MTFDYDKVGDVLYLFRGEPYTTDNVELDRHFVLRLHPKSHEIVGLMILDLTDFLGTSVNIRTLPALAQSFQLQIETLNSLRTDDRIRQLLLAS